MSGTGTKRELVGISVNLEVLTKDQLRRFVFGVAKGQENGIDSWTVDFKLMSRAAIGAEFVQMVALTVKLDLKKVHAEDVETTANKGFNKNQVDFVQSTLADDTDRFKNGKLKESRLARTLGEVFAARHG